MAHTRNEEEIIIDKTFQDEVANVKRLGGRILLVQMSHKFGWEKR